jgi:hypothetical protein
LIPIGCPSLLSVGSTRLAIDENLFFLHKPSFSICVT